VVGMLSRSDVVRMLSRSDEDLEQAVDALLASVGLVDWVAEVSEGTVALSGPADSSQHALARLVASTVPGVVDVRVV
jgi:osmotically-inducible protein OsmY